MRNIISTVKPNEKTSIADVLNGLKDYSGQCRIDFTSSKIIVDIAEEEKIDEMIDFINQNYAILRVDIAEKQRDSKADGNSVLTFVNDEELVIHGNHHTSSKVLTALDKLLKTMNLALASTSKISDDDICHYIDTCKHEMLMKFNPYLRVKEMHTGDVVAVNYGMHVFGEPSGEIFSVVCDVSDTMICVVPILKMAENNISNENCAFEENKGIYTRRTTPKGYLMFDKARYVRKDRVQYVLGKISKDYLEEIMSKLAKAFDFSDK